MISTLLLLTPAALATPPAIVEVCDVKTTYNWESQILVIEGGKDTNSAKPMNGSLRGTQSFLSSKLVIDDWNSD